MNTDSMRQYLECVADQRLQRLGFAPVYGSENPFSFMELQGVQELTNFFERRPSAYQVAVEARSTWTRTSSRKDRVRLGRPMELPWAVHGPPMERQSS